jgi:hypothetical protein
LHYTHVVPEIERAAIDAAAHAMLGAEGYDVAKVLRVLDSWMDEAVHGVQYPPGRTA